MKTTISYRVDLVKGTAEGKYGIFINPIHRSNIKKNNETGHRRFYCNEKGYKKLREFFDKQWQNNITSNEY